MGTRAGLRPSLLPLILLAALAGASCTAPDAPPQGGARAGAGGGGASGPQPTRRNTLTVGISSDIDNLATKLGTVTATAEFNAMSNSPLALRDAKGVARPLLAVELPSRDRGTWVVNPDGTMRTTWKIKPNARWHDGRPVMPADFVLAHKVALDEAIPARTRIPEQFMERLEPLDDKTFVIHWNQSYPWAHELITRDLEPLPQHILATLYETLDALAFMAHPFFSSPAYVGEGPYRLVRWDYGTQVVYRAFDDYFMGRPKIDEVIFKIIPDTSTIIANILAGQVDTAFGSTLGHQAGATVKEQWSRSGAGDMVITPARWRHIQIQFNTDYLEQPALLDRRVRRAIVHGIDRESLARIMTAGLSGVADIFLVPTDPLYARADREVTKYPYDPSRALALLREAGWTKRGDTLVNASGAPFALDARNSQGQDNETESSIMAANLRELGMQVSETIMSSARMTDREYRSKFPGLNGTAFSIDVPEIMTRSVTSTCPDPSRRYIGRNLGCWTNAEFDRLYLVASSSLDPAERDTAVVRGLQILTEDVGLFGLSYVSENIPVPKGLIGPGPKWPGQPATNWDIHEWHWQ